MTRMAVNGVQLNVDVRGNMSADATPLLLIHGFMGSINAWKNLGPKFEERYKLIRVDVLGHGESDSPEDAQRYRMEHVTQDLLTVLDQLKIDSANVLGYSMGGRIALNLAVTAPKRVKVLVLESSSPGLADQAERQARAENDDAAATRLEHDGLAAFVEYWTNLPLFASQKKLPDHIRADIYSQRLQNTVTGVAGALRGLSPGIQPSLWSALSTLPMPILLIMGALDEKYVKIGQQMAASIPNATLNIVPDAGHTVHVEQPESFSKIVWDYLQQHTDTQSK
jgi:2-succinyl-6-hydroxy-2,4-cyclohexadiene-1-carboxylate synthase